MTRTSAIAKLTQTKLEEHHRLSGHVRVRANVRKRRLVYHVTHGQGLAINVEVGRAFLTQPHKLLGRIDMIRLHAVQMLCGERLADAVRVEERVQ